jgi:hypothetical protein
MDNAEEDLIRNGVRWKTKAVIRMDWRSVVGGSQGWNHVVAPV